MIRDEHEVTHNPEASEPKADEDSGGFWGHSIHVATPATPKDAAYAVPGAQGNPHTTHLSP